MGRKPCNTVLELDFLAFGACPLEKSTAALTVRLEHLERRNTAPEELEGQPGLLSSRFEARENEPGASKPMLKDSQAVLA